MNRSQQKAYLTGKNGMDTVGGFNNSFSMAGKYEEAHGGGNPVFISTPDYTNPSNNLHDNIGSRVMLEQYFDNKLFIDSSIKDHTRHPDPFKFVVKFNGIEPKTESVYVNIDNEQYDYKIYVSGDTEIIFDRVFKNIRCATVNALIMPNYLTFKTDDDGSYQPTGKKLAKTHYKYIVLKISELRNGKCYSNNPNLGRESFIMKMDTDICFNNQIWIPIHNSVGYFDSQLKNIERLTIEICNDKGERLTAKLDGKVHDFFADYKNTIDKIKSLEKIGTREAKNKIESLTPKLKSLKEITQSLSPEVHLTFNTLESQINTLPQFRY